MYFLQYGSGGDDVYLPWFSFPMHNVSFGGFDGSVGVKFGHKGTIVAVFAWHISTVQILPEPQTVWPDDPIHALKLYGPVHTKISVGEHSPEQSDEQSGEISSLGF